MRNTQNDNADRRLAPVASSVTWGQMLRYKTDDRDISSSELCIMKGGNGDWYVAVADGPDHYPTNGVRICTSGGAAVACPGLGLAISKAYNAMFTAQNRFKSGDGGRWTSEIINRQLPAVASTAGFSGELP